jgi:hypothetical protein
MSLLLLIIILLFFFGGGFGVYSGHPWGAPGLGIGGILLIIVVVMLLFGRL